MKQRIILSVIAMMGSVFLLIFASFAWFTVSNSDNVDGTDVNIIDLNVEVTLEMSGDGISYVSCDRIAVDDIVPGDTLYFRISVINNGTVDANVKISLSGFTDLPADPNFSYDDTKTLRDMVIVNCTNTLNSEEIVNQTISDLLPYMPSGDYSTSAFDLVSSLSLPISGSGIIYFDFQVSGSAGNDYQNLSMQVSSLIVQSAISS